MDLTEREACRCLSGALDIPRSQARLALKAGLAGAGHRRGNALLYDRDAVARLAGRTEWSQGRLESAFPGGLFVARIAPRRGFDAGAPWDVKAAVVSHDWELSLGARMQVLLAAARRGGLPFVATVSGFVVLGATITGIAEVVALHEGTHGWDFQHRPRTRRLSRLALGRPGGWFDELADARITSGPGNSWFTIGDTAFYRGPAVRPPLAE